MSSVLLLFAHPALEKSRVNRQLVDGLADLPGVTFHDLYEEYPDFHIDVQWEQELLLQHEIVIWHHPLYWYSVPPLLKQWIDLTLQHDWAYGSRGVYLKGKKVLSVITSGAERDSYAPGAFNRHEIGTFLLPLRRTAELCGMDYLPPYFVDGTHRMDEQDINTARAAYHAFLREITTSQPDFAAWAGQRFSNDYFSQTSLHHG